MNNLSPVCLELAESDVSRGAVLCVLDEVLARAVRIAFELKRAHWNLAKGPTYFKLCKLFDRVHAQALGWADLMAERTVELGGVAGASLGVVAPRGALLGPGDQVEALWQWLASFDAAVGDAIGEANTRGDADTGNIFTQIARSVDKMRDLVQAHRRAGD